KKATCQSKSALIPRGEVADEGKLLRLLEAYASVQRRIFLDSRFGGNDVMPALRLRSGQAPAGIQCSLSLGNPLRTLLRQRANYAQSSDYFVSLVSPVAG